MSSTLHDILDKRMNPNFKFYVNREGGIPGRMRFMLNDDNMRDEYLGACLDYIRWGGQTTIMYELGTSGMITFVEEWMRVNHDNLIWTTPRRWDIILPLKDKDGIITLEEMFDRLNQEPKYTEVKCISRTDNPFGCNKYSQLTPRQRYEYSIWEKCPGHIEETNRTVHPFDGWDLAGYVERLYNQDPGKAITRISPQLELFKSPDIRKVLGFVA